MNRPRCESCKAFNVMGPDCRRKSPTAVLIQSPSGAVAAGVFPAASAEGWCLEHVAIINAEELLEH